MMLTVEYLTGLLSQIDSLTKELKDSDTVFDNIKEIK